jgi:excisionase family DNA binding protein
VSGRLLTLGEAASRLACSTRTLRRRIKDGSLPAFRDGGLVRVRQDDLERYVAAKITRQRLAHAGAPVAGVALPTGARLWDE